MRILFIGSADIAIPSIRILLENKIKVVGVISQPDRPAGRKKILTSTPLKSYCVNCNIDVFTPEKIESDESYNFVKKINPSLIVVVAYGQFIPEKIINLATHRAINLHPSLLPKYRGATPIQHSLLNGDSYTGVSIIDVSKKMDCGDILLQKKINILDEDDYLSLYKKLSNIGAFLLKDAITGILNNNILKISQIESESTYVKKISKEDGNINWNDSAKKISNKIRAFKEWPGSYCTLPNGKKLIIWKVSIEMRNGYPGEILDDNLLIGTGKESIRLIEVQIPSKKRISAESFLNGNKLKVKSKMLF